MKVESKDELTALLPGLIDGVTADEETFVRLAGKKFLAWSATRFFIAQKDQEDFAIEVIEKALAKINRYHPSKGSFTTWLFVLARNHAADHGRRLRDGRDVLYGALPEDTLEWERTAVDFRVEDEEEEPDRRPALVALDAAVATLPQDDQELIDMIYSGFSATEIAKMRGGKPPAIRQQHHRILHKLCQILNHPR